MKEKTLLNVYKVTLGTGREVILREMKIKHQELAAKAVGSKAGDNQMLFVTMMQKELLKILLVEVDGKAVTGIQLEDLDSLFTYQEYGQLSRVMGKIMGDESDMGKFQIELASSGNT
jgi:hypothetical protein